MVSKLWGDSGRPDFFSIGKPINPLCPMGIWVDYQNISTAIEAGIRFTE